MICDAKHTAFQPTDEQWVCPKCGDKENFYIDEPDQEANEECDKLHNNDEVRCDKCGFGASGKTVASKLQKLHHREVCPTCKGAGTIPLRTKQ